MSTTLKEAKMESLKDKIEAIATTEEVVEEEEEKKEEVK